jgi:hypothetical protein
MRDYAQRARVLDPNEFTFVPQPAVEPIAA